ncbi:hypothetical protein CerSpe_163350 [Prunus speciosa]
MLFASKKELREAISHYAINEGYKVKVTKNDRKRMQAMCMKCKWNLWDSFMADETLQIKSMIETHTCSRSYSNPQATASFLAKKYLDRLRDEPKMRLRLFQALIKREIGYEVSQTCGRARQKAIEIIEGTYASQYSKLWEYCAEVRETNVGSIMMMKIEAPYFQGLYVCLDACKKRLSS